MSKNSNSFKGNLGITIRIGASHDDVTVTDKRLPNAKPVHFDRAALGVDDRAKGLKAWEGSRANTNAALTDAWAEDRGFQKAGRADKRAKDQKFKQRRRNRDE
jgi:hypothetical protein